MLINVHTYNSMDLKVHPTIHDRSKSCLKRMAFVVSQDSQLSPWAFELQRA